VRNLIGANMSFRRELVDEVGGFTSDLGRVWGAPTGCEETELCIRMRERWPEGHFVYDPRARVMHRVPEDRGRVSYFAARCHAEGRSKAILARRHGAALALATERAYVRRTLRAALVSAVRDASRGSALRSAAIVFGLTITAAGYAAARLLRLASVTAR
jgi:cellulose synthase/poly-beta-1,6-N-acetylglucosamine synthase-like glycosyltransferase